MGDRKKQRTQVRQGSGCSGRAGSRWRDRPWRGMIVTLCVGMAAAGLFFPHAGTFLVASDPITHAEIGLVLSGDPIARSLAARDLYHQGRVDRILVIPEPPNLLDGELVKLGLLDPHLPPWSQRVLVASGVPASAFHRGARSLL